MTDKAEVDAGPPATADVQDPLPEGSFFYRRIFSYLCAASFTVLLGITIWRIEGDADLRRVAMYLCLLQFVVVTYYMVAPSAEQVVKMLQTVKMFLGGVSRTTTAVVRGAQSEATTRTSTGRRAASKRHGSHFPEPPFGE